jgi:hypothetical protein
MFERLTGYVKLKQQSQAVQNNSHPSFIGGLKTL